MYHITFEDGSNPYVGKGSPAKWKRNFILAEVGKTGEITFYHAFDKETYKGIHETQHSGKLTGFRSISTSVKLNKYCRERAGSSEKDCICTHCYADQYASFRKSLRGALERNHKLLTAGVLDKGALPFIHDKYYRLESFGDLNNEAQFVNYINLCNKNKKTRFTIWTKNPWIMERVFNSGVKKPRNLTIILSSPMIGQKTDASRYPFVDKTFTVYPKGTDGINCGGKSCMSCLLCYDAKFSKVTDIREELK